MTLFVDASAMVAMLLDEPEKDWFTDELDRDVDRIWSGVARWETVVNLARVRKFDINEAEAKVDELSASFAIRIVPVSDTESRLAIQAYATFGKQRHPAGLNMGDCFAYACAKAHGARLLYKGNDFEQTDMAWSGA
ncbi:type II toxin-antitoxin system VapC family toxin [Sphingomonas sp. M1-B02]|uniref:type II toxin-antitoxin system VapC family toxin n=1 Tax=Sphingomonas sp. M1-B02 TaxID=3114300 RepID=UPI00223FDA13|nr:type II toxin-antitoxin system VapC family toxin [Sphingomonas sp. S6-11]UZK64788.1 type II toxin-antitoxin system VapC family toxin [Sphingomonas sp. S6-11]